MEEYRSLQDLYSKQEEFESDLQQTKRHLFEKIQESYHIMQEQMVALVQDHTHRVLTTVAETIADTECKFKNTLDITKHMIQDVKLKAHTVRRLRLHNEEAEKGDDSRSCPGKNISEVMVLNEDEPKKKHKKKIQENLETMKRNQNLDDSLGAFSEESLKLKSSTAVEWQESVPRAISTQHNPLNYLINRQHNYIVRSLFDSNECEICAVCCLDNGCIVLADANNKCLKILDNGFGLLKSISSDWEVDQPTGLGHLYDNRFVLSDRGRLKYFSIDSLGNTYMIRTVSTGVKSWNVVSYREYIYILCENNRHPYYNIRRYGNNGTHYGCDEMEGQFMCFNSNGSKLYVTDGINQSAKSNTVRVFNTNTSGRKMFKKASDLSSPDLKTPCGVVTDKYDNIYVCGFDSKNIIQFDKHGNQVDILLDEENVLTGQKILGYDKTNHRLIVAGQSDEIKILDLK